MENIDFKALFNSPEPDTIEQQKSQPPYVYHCGIQQLEPYRQQERKQEVLELEYTAVVELMRQLSDERKAGNEQNAHNTGR